VCSSVFFLGLSASLSDTGQNCCEKLRIGKRDDGDSQGLIPTFQPGMRDAIDRRPEPRDGPNLRRPIRKLPEQITDLNRGELSPEKSHLRPQPAGTLIRRLSLGSAVLAHLSEWVGLKAFSLNRNITGSADSGRWGCL
jgi:hypothetical protein